MAFTDKEDTARDRKGRAKPLNKNVRMTSKPPVRDKEPYAMLE
jgi:hypothetical protein